MADREDGKIKTTLGLAAWLVASAALGDDNYLEIVDDQLSRMRGAVDAIAEERLFLRANDGEVVSFYLHLDRRVPYVIVGACDQDCDDLDLVLYDEENNEVGRDGQTDSLPIVEIEPTSTGLFRLDTIMYSCTTEPCYYSVAVFEQ